MDYNNIEMFHENLKRTPKNVYRKITLIIIPKSKPKSSLMTPEEKN